jgi:hypothetical protein
MPTVFVRALPDAGFRRAGRFFPQTGEIVEVDDETLAVLRAEPKLEVRDPKGAPPGTPVAGEPEHEAALREAIARIEALEAANAALAAKLGETEAMLSAATAPAAEVESKKAKK